LLRNVPLSFLSQGFCMAQVPPNDVHYTGHLAIYIPKKIMISVTTHIIISAWPLAPPIENAPLYYI
jgi:hypothetical protein